MVHRWFPVPWDPEQSSDSTGAWARPTWGSWRVSWGGRSWLWHSGGTRRLKAEPPPPRPHHNETETVIYNLTNKSLRSDGFTGEFYQAFREELTPLSLKHLEKLQRKTHSQTHSMKLPSTWYQIQAKIPHTQKENYRSISLMNIDAKICSKIPANRIQWYIKRIIYHDKVGLFPGMQGFVSIHKSTVWYTTLTY